MAWVQYNDGGIHNVTTTISGDVWVDFEAPGIGTTVNILSGGSIPKPYKLQGFEDSNLDISDGLVYELFANDSSQVTISGGTIGHYLKTYNTSRVTISGGKVGSLEIRNIGLINWSGGTIEGFLQLDTNAILTINGSDFAIDGSSVGFGEISSILGSAYSDEPYRTLTGTLANDDIINNQFRIGDAAQIVLAV